MTIITFLALLALFYLNWITFGSQCEAFCLNTVDLQVVWKGFVCKDFKVRFRIFFIGFCLVACPDSRLELSSAVFRFCGFFLIAVIGISYLLQSFAVKCVTFLGLSPSFNDMWRLLMFWQETWEYHSGCIHYKLRRIFTWCLFQNKV